MSIHQESHNGKTTFVAIAQAGGTRIKKRFWEGAYPSLGEAHKAALAWELAAKRNTRRQEDLGVSISARGMVELVGWSERAAELGVDLRKIFEAGITSLNGSIQSTQSKTFSQAVALYDPELVFANRSEDYLRQVRLRLAAFGTEVGNLKLDQIRTQTVQAFLEARRFAPKGSRGRPRPLGSTAWNNWLRDFSVFFNWAIRKKLLSENPALGVLKKVKSREELAQAPNVWLPELCQEVFDHCRGAWNYRTGTPGAARGDVPYIAIGLLCGLRPQETARLDWGRHFDWERGEIWVSPDIAKTRANRYVPMPPNLRAILEPYRKDSGPLTDTPRNVYQRLRKAGFSLPQDTLRHTFCSWNLALYEDPEKTRLRMGHGKDSELLFSVYRALMKKDVAAKYLDLK